MKTKRVSNFGGGIYIPKIVDKRFICFHIGPVLAYNSNKYETQIRNKEKIEFLKNRFFRNRGKIICCYGEIDIRVWILKKSEEAHKSFQVTIEEVIKEYLQFLLWLKEDGYDVWVCGPIPSQKDNEVINISYPRYGSETIRNSITRVFNERLCEICKSHGFGFISIFHHLIDEKNLTKEFYLADGCHLSENARPLLEIELEKNGFYK